MKSLKRGITLPLLVLFLWSPVICADIKFFKQTEIASGKEKGEILIKVIDVKADKRGNIFVLDEGDNRIKKFASNGRFIKSAGGKGEGPGELLYPSFLTLDNEGKIYVGEIVGHRLLEFDSQLNFVKQIKFPFSRGFSDVFIHSDKFIYLYNVVLEGEKYFYIFSKDGRPLISFFDKRHKYAPRMKTLYASALISNVGTLSYLLGFANFKNGKIAFTYMRPENPYTVYILDLEGNVIKTLQNKIKDYDPREYYNFAKNYDPRKDRGKKKIDFDMFGIRGLHFTKEEFLIIQIEKASKDGKIEYFLDIFTPEGKLLFNHYAFTERIFSVDHENNVYTLAENEEQVSVIKYKLILNR